MSLSRLLALSAFGAATLGAFLFAIVPADHIAVADKSKHAFAFYVLTVLGLLALQRVARWKLALGLAGYGLLIEVVQGLPIVGRQADVRDLMVDCAAIAIALVPSFAQSWRGGAAPDQKSLAPLEAS